VEHLERDGRAHVQCPRQHGWDVPLLAPSLSSGDIAGLIDKKSNWEKVYAIGYRSCSFDQAGKLPPRSEELVSRMKGKVELNDSLLWWVAGGFDAIIWWRKHRGHRIFGQRRDHQILEHSEQISRLFRRLHFHRRPAQRLSDKRLVMSEASWPRRGLRDRAGLYLIAVTVRSISLTGAPDARIHSCLGSCMGAVYALIGVTYNTMFSTSRVMSFTAGQLGMLGGVFGSLFILRLGCRRSRALC